MEKIDTKISGDKKPKKYEPRIRVKEYDQRRFHQYNCLANIDQLVKLLNSSSIMESGRNTPRKRTRRNLKREIRTETKPDKTIQAGQK